VSAVMGSHGLDLGLKAKISGLGFGLDALVLTVLSKDICNCLCNVITMPYMRNGCRIWH